MAPKVDDDFIFTISDADDVSDDGGFDDEPSDIAKVAAPGKKRKHAEDLDLHVKPKDGPRKKAKKGKKGKDIANQDDGKDEIDVAEPEDDDNDIVSDFEFAIGDVNTDFVEDFDGWGDENAIAAKAKAYEHRSTAVDVDEIIARRQNKKNKTDKVTAATQDEIMANDDFEGFGDDDELLAGDGFGMGAETESEDEDEDDDGDEEIEGDGSDDEDEKEQNEDSDNESVAAPVPHPMDVDAASDEDEEDAVEAKKAAEFFAPEETISSKKKGAKITGSSGSFQSLSLSRPILRGLTSVGFTEPTPIQLKTIPVALEGKDVVGGAVTGSGKTAAFLIPIMERLLYRPKKIPTTRVAIFMPTRELAVQCYNVAVKLAAFTDITFAQMAGGFSLREQEAVLKKKPDVVIATPGRFIDHMNNSAGFEVDTLEILVLDEADRMLEEGFESQLSEILTTIPKSRQTMLFSATMTSSVDKLIRVGMNRPMRLMVDAKKQTVSGLTQEIIRLRLGKEDRRLAYLLYVCHESFQERVIIFFRQKKEAHRVRVVFALCGLKANELHGNMTQEQRIQSVEAFRSGKSSYLLATDVASRGLDIKNVSTVINYEAPQTHEIYLHRVGRTARAGRTGHACTLVAEPDRKIVKQAVKAAREQGAKLVSRIVPPEEAEKWIKKVKDLEDEIEEVLKEEKEERILSITERDLKRGENLIKHEDEIKSRPRRTWFESEKDKQTAREKGAAALNGPAEGSKDKKKKKKLSGKDRKKLEASDVRREGKVWKKGKEPKGAGPGRDDKNKNKNKNKTGKATRR